MMRDNKTGKTNVAIVGGGTGLTAAWALENLDQFNVTLFEAQNRLGGHINSIVLNGVTMEGGAEFIGNEEVYPNVHRLFRLLGMRLQEFELNMEFHDYRNPENNITLPPILHTSHGKESPEPARKKKGFSLSRFFSRKRKKVIQPDTQIDLHTIAHDKRELFNFLTVILKAKRELAQSDQFMTLEEFIDDFKAKCPDIFCKRGDFADHVLYPLIAAGWGVSVEDIKKFNASYAMHYLEAGEKWYDAVDGLSTYINTLQGQCKQTEINLNTKIKKLVPVLVDGKLKYKLQRDDDTFVSNDEGVPIAYSDVVLTTPAYVTHELLADINTTTLADLIKKAPRCERRNIRNTIKEIMALHDALKAVEYFDTTVAFHQDPTYQSEPHTVVHTRYDGVHAANTMCKRWKFGEKDVPIMKTWVLPGQSMPNNVLHVAHYRHPKMDRRYFDAQQALHRAQTKLGLHFGGILAGSNDAHESGVTTSLQIAARLSQRENCLGDNQRLANFPDVIASIQPEMLEQQGGVFAKSHSLFAHPVVTASSNANERANAPSCSYH